MNVFELIKKKLEKHIAETYYESVKGNRDAGVRNNTYHNAKDIVEEVEKEYNNGWIPCSERMPQFNEYVLCSVNDKYADHKIIISKFKDEEYWHNGRIVAWQPLPAPYKEGGSDDR